MSLSSLYLKCLSYKIVIVKMSLSSLYLKCLSYKIEYHDSGMKKPELFRNKNPRHVSRFDI